MTSYESAMLLANTLDGKKGEEIKVLKTEGLTTLADYFVICTATSTTQIKALAEECAATLNEWATSESGRSERFTSMYEAADQYVPQAIEALGATPESGMGAYYVGSQLLTPDTLKSYGTTLTDALDAAGKGVWTTVDLGMSIGVMCDVNPLDADTLENFKTNYDLLSLLKKEELEAQVYADGAAMEQNLDTSAMNTYKASKIKTTA